MNNIQDNCNWRRPNLDDGREMPRQKDLVDLYKPSGERFGLMEVDNYLMAAVTRSMYLTESGFEKHCAVANVPPTLGIVCAEGKGTFDWKAHDHSFCVGHGSCTLVNLSRPDDGHSYLFHGYTDILVRHVFVPHYFIHQKAELYPSQLEAVSRMVEGFAGDASMDIRHLTSAPVYQNALAAIFSQPLLGNSSEEYVADNIITLLDVFSDKPQPASLEKIGYDAALRTKVLEARDIIASDIKNPLSLRQLALAVGTNENYLKAGFKHEFGISVFGYLFECRMQTARRLLLDPQLSIDRIAMAVGYTDPLSFYRPFRRRFGITPMQYRSSAIRGGAFYPPPFYNTLYFSRLLMWRWTGVDVPRSLRTPLARTAGLALLPQIVPSGELYGFLCGHLLLLRSKVFLVDDEAESVSRHPLVGSHKEAVGTG